MVFIEVLSQPLKLVLELLLVKLLPAKLVLQLTCEAPLPLCLRMLGIDLRLEIEIVAGIETGIEATIETGIEAGIGIEIETRIGTGTGIEIGNETWIKILRH